MTKTILIVDDEERIRKVYSTIFAREGFRVLQSPDAATANEMLVRQDVDLILLDINMAQVDGTVLYDLIQVFHRKAKVIVSSVYPLEDQRHLIEAATDYYDKAESITLLIRKVRDALGERAR